MMITARSFTADPGPCGVGADKRRLRGVLRDVPVAGQQVCGMPEPPVARLREFGEVLVCTRHCVLSAAARPGGSCVTAALRPGYAVESGLPPLVLIRLGTGKGCCPPGTTFHQP